MHLYKKYIHVILFLILVLMILSNTADTKQSTPLYPINFNPLAIETTKELDERIQKITKKSDELYEKPEDAYIDNVWKKTPGRDGRRVDIDQTMKNMKKEDRVDASLFIYESIKPSIHLSDLPPSPIYRGHPDKDMVALLINVSWGTEYIPSILKTLNQHDVKATFFLEGKWAKQETAYVEMIHDEGHLIGNHAYNHPDMQRLSTSEMRKQIEQTNEIIRAITDEEIEWFAPPSGSFNMTVVEEAAALNMETILWTVDTIDWKNPSTQVMHDRVMDHIHNGATILMHPTEAIAKGLDSLIESIEKEGYRLGTIEQLLRTER